MSVIASPTPFELDDTVTLVSDTIHPGVGQARGAVVVERSGSRFLLATNATDSSLQAWAYLMDPLAATNLVQVPQESIDQLVEREGSAIDWSEPASATESSSTLRIDEQELTRAGLGQERSPAVKLLGGILFDAMNIGASDVHLEAVETGMNVKCRLDGVLSPLGKTESQTLSDQVVSRIKVLSELDIAENRIPQDGRFRIRFEQRPVDVRVSIVPSVHGEDVVLRILDRHHLAQELDGLTLSKLGFDDAIGARFKSLCELPHGLVLVTGPTGSGKTTTLYATLAETHQATQKVVTIEDPVEYQLPGILQIPVNEKKGLTFARGLRSVLRHDPDRVLIGEIRDAETAAIAVQSALTGHVVYATVHANSAVDVLGRFSQLGIDPFSLSSAMNGVLAQRLIRKTCQACQGSGCDDCRDTGYRGRVAVGELLVMSPALRAQVNAGATIDDIRALAIKEGMAPMREQALAMQAAGITTLAEVNRVSP